MSKLRQVVTILAEYVASDNMDVPDSVEKAAGVYAQACRQANEKLAACDQLLRANQRSEALRQAQLEPDVLKLYADLTFPGRELWEEVAGRVGLDIPPRLNAAVAQRLNKAFAESQTIEDLLRQHRELALARAPLQRRLDILRLLLKAEPANLGWADDLRAYEAARFEEMRAQLAAHQGEFTWEEVCGLLDDISSDAWVSPPPLDLVGTIQEMHAGHRRVQGEKLLGAINARLSRAVADGNLTAARELEDRVVAVVKGYGIPETSRLLGPYRQAADWIDRELKFRKRKGQFDKAVDQLRAALKDGVDWAYVQEYYHVASSFEPDLSIPRDVSREFADRARRRRLGWWVLAAVGGGVALLGGVGTGIYMMLSGSR